MEGNYGFFYSLKYYDEINGNEVESKGICFGKGISDVAGRLEDFYGDGIMEVRVVEVNGEDGIIELDEIKECL